MNVKTSYWDATNSKTLIQVTLKIQNKLFLSEINLFY